MKKLLALLLLFVIVGCSEPIAPPEEIAASYYHNLIKGNPEEAYMFLSHKDKNETTIDDFKSSVFFDIGGETPTSTNKLSINDEFGFSKMLLNLSNIELVNFTTYKNNSIVEFEVEVVDFELVFAKLFEKIFSNFLNIDEFNKSSNIEKEDYVSDAYNQLDSSQLPRKKLKNVKINLIKEELGWAVYIDLKNLVNLKEKKLLQEKIESERIAEQEKIESERIAEESLKEQQRLEEERKLEAERLDKAAEKLEKELEAKIIAAENALRDSTITVSMTRDEFTDRPKNISMIFLPHEEEGSYNAKTIGLVKYIGSSYGIVLMNQEFSIDDSTRVKFRFDDKNLFSSRFSRASDNIFNRNEMFFYEFLRELENTNQLLIGIDGEGSFKTATYYNLEEKFKKFLCLIDEHDFPGVSESQLKLFPTKYYQYKEEDCIKKSP